MTQEKRIHDLCIPLFSAPRLPALFTPPMTSGSPRRFCTLPPERERGGGGCHTRAGERGQRSKERTQGKCGMGSCGTAAILHYGNFNPLNGNVRRRRGGLTQPRLRPGAAPSSRCPAALPVCVLWILMAMQRSVKEEVIGCPARPFVCINTQLFGSLTALFKDESRESRRD